MENDCAMRTICLLYTSPSPRDGETHRVVEIGLLHLVFEVDGHQFLGNFSHIVVTFSAHNRSLTPLAKRNPEGARLRIQYEKCVEYTDPELDRFRAINKS